MIVDRLREFREVGDFSWINLKAQHFVEWLSPSLASSDYKPPFIVDDPGTVDRKCRTYNQGLRYLCSDVYACEPVGPFHYADEVGRLFYNAAAPTVLHLCCSGLSSSESSRLAMLSSLLSRKAASALEELYGMLLWSWRDSWLQIRMLCSRE
mmetsp:Transcript_8334/g.16472  ORF Transcript_8334/g.16472 Transcript_8334/m.16472 type:complete len:152 (-) Transcript_8334:2367-2822(-)